MTHLPALFLFFAILSVAKKMCGEVEVDETFIGGKARNMHIDVKKRRITATGPTDKTAVFGVLERGDKGKGTYSTVRTVVIQNRKKKTLQAEVQRACSSWLRAVL